MVNDSPNDLPLVKKFTIGQLFTKLFTIGKLFINGKYSISKFL